MATNIYIDGFNLYYGSVRRFPQLKWLNLAELCRRLLPSHQINRIRYFTSRISASPNNSQGPARQDLYLRALRTLPNLHVHYGRFASREVSMPLSPLRYLPGRNRPETVPVIRTEEKRSDVNLASYLLLDCFDDDFDDAVIVSNDSDFTLPVEIVGTRFGKSVGMINPHPRKSLSRELTRATAFQVKSINRSVLAASQFPDELTDAQGTFRRPSRWR